MENKIMLNDMIQNHSIRMNNLKKYYPFFRLWENGLNLYKDGMYDMLDMPYITLAIIRYFLEENSFNHRSVTYEMYADFMKQILLRDFDLRIEGEEREELINYIFDKLCNEGKPFTATWFDPYDKKRKTSRIKLIESHIQDQKIIYDLTPEAIEFYLETKEVKDESPMSVDQVLLGKMIVSRDYKSGFEILRRINQEVQKMVAQKDAIVRIFAHNVFEGAKALEQFSKQGLRWFEDEQQMFAKNQVLIDQAMRAMSDHKAVKDIYAMDVELKKAMQRHGELLSACMQLQIKADELIQRAKLNRFKKNTDFIRLRELMIENDQLSALNDLVLPLFGMKIQKSFQLMQLDDLLDYKSEDQQLKEVISENIEQAYVYDDEIVEDRIQNNYQYLLKVLFDQLLEKNRVELSYLVHLYQLKFGQEIYSNGDLYSFLVHLGQKDTYQLAQILEVQDTFLESTIRLFLEDKNNQEKYSKMIFKITFDHEHKVQTTDDFEITNMIFERVR